MSKKPKPTSEADLIAAIRKRLQEAPNAMKSTEELAERTKGKTGAKKATRILDRHKTNK
jgi:hypothetical protein